MKKILSILMCFLLLISLVACSNNSPKKLVTDCCQAIKSWDIDEASKFIGGGIDLNSKKYNSDLYNALIDSVKKSSEKMNYKIVDENVDGDNAYVTVEFDYIDVTNAVNDAWQKLYSKAEYMNNNGSLGSLMNEFVSDFESYLENNSDEKSNISTIFTCTKHEKTWQISNVEIDKLLQVMTCNLVNAFSNILSSYR